MFNFTYDKGNTQSNTNYKISLEGYIKKTVTFGQGD